MSGEKTHEIHDRRRARNLAVLFGVLGVAAALFLVTVLKLQIFAASPFAKSFKPQIGKTQEDVLRARDAEGAAE